MQDGPNNSRKSTLAPSQVIWYGGMILTGGLAALTFALLYSSRNNEYKDLEKKLEDKEIVYVREIDSLAREVKSASDRYVFLKADNDALSSTLAKEQARSSFLSSTNATLRTKEKQITSSYSTLQAASAKANAENKALKDEAALLRSQIQYLQGLLDERDRTIARQKAENDNLYTGLEVNKLALNDLRDSVRSENVSGYFNNTELGAAYGLSSISVPYSKYFFGVTTVNGYVINKRFRTGIGVGLYGYNGGLMAPIYLDVRFSFEERKLTPYLFADGGFMFDFEDFNLPNTLFMNPGIGLYHNLSEKLTLNIGAGAFVQMHDTRSSYINLRIGITYKKKSGGR